MSKKPKTPAPIRKPVGTPITAVQSTVDEAPHVLGNSFGVSAESRASTPAPATIQFDKTVPDWFTNPQDARDYLAVYAIEELEHGRIPMFFTWACRRSRIGSGIEAAFGIMQSIGSILVKQQPRLTAVVRAKLLWANAQLKADRAVESNPNEAGNSEREAQRLNEASRKALDAAELPMSHLGNESSDGVISSSKNVPPGIREATVNAD